MKILSLILLTFLLVGCETRNPVAPPTKTSSVERVGDPTSDDGRRIPMQGPLLPGQERPTILVKTGTE